MKDDTVGHFEGGPGTLVADRYRIVKDVGLGTFGRVVKCVDLQARNNDGATSSASGIVAIKLVRNIKRYYDSAVIEADIVRDVNRRGGRGLSLISIMYDSFDLPSGHYALVFECLGRSLYDFLKSHDYRPFPLYCVRDFARQLLDALDFLHSFKLIHTDLKPENILLTTNGEFPYRDYDGSELMVPASTRIKVIDFGGATYDYEKKSSVVNTRQYRAPEVILGLGWSMPSDLWSAGCIIAELYTGELLFATHDNTEHLALIERAVGPFPRDMVDRATTNGDAFDSRGMHRGRDVLSSSSMDHVRKMGPIDTIVSDHDKDSGLIELFHALLNIDPSRRATAGEALHGRVDGLLFG